MLPPLSNSGLFELLHCMWVSPLKPKTCPTVTQVGEASKYPMESCQPVGQFFSLRNRRFVKWIGSQAMSDLEVATIEKWRCCAGYTFSDDQNAMKWVIFQDETDSKTWHFDIRIF